MAAGLAALAWGLWCFLHSVLIDSPMSRVLRRALGRWAATYRLLYNLFSLVSVVLLYGWQQTLAQAVVITLPSWTVWPRGLLLAYALCMFIAGSRAYDSRAFLGIGQIRDARAGRPPARPQFAAGGILRYVRHPWYSGALALLWCSASYTDVDLAVHLVLTAYIIIGTLLEEGRLVRQFGDAYRHYRRQVPMLLPRLPISGAK